MENLELIDTVFIDDAIITFFQFFAGKFMASAIQIIILFALLPNK